jgi:hypothetical protein
MPDSSFRTAEKANKGGLKLCQEATYNLGEEGDKLINSLATKQDVDKLLVCRRENEFFDDSR